jgi:glycoprotein-N-acetylgalactosamine 3-beta-galactosyltransferase
MAPENPTAMDCSQASVPRLPPELSFICQDPAVSLLVKVESPPDPPPKILCVVLTHEASHATRLDAILETWGRKCHSFIAASDKEDLSRHAHRVEAEEGYWGIWDKLMQTLRMILEKNMDFDWILKADDDTYMIMENLHAFLSNQTNEAAYSVHSQPLIYGRVMPWPTLGELGTNFGWFTSPKQMKFRARFYAKFPNKQELFRYAHGGPGYIMNRNYVQILVKAYFHSVNVIHGRISEDLANAFTMLYRNITPRSTIDAHGKERSHPESPWTMYANPKWLPWIQENIQNRGDGASCCSPTSISYHHVNHREMKLLDYQIYKCPTP